MNQCPECKIQYPMNPLSKENIEDTIKQSAEFSNFSQAVKMQYLEDSFPWKQRIGLSEVELDRILLLAWEEFKK